MIEIITKVAITAVGVFVAVSGGLVGTAAVVAAAVIGGLWRR